MQEGYTKEQANSVHPKNVVVSMRKSIDRAYGKQYVLEMKIAKQEDRTPLSFDSGLLNRTTLLQIYHFLEQ